MSTETSRSIYQVANFIADVKEIVREHGVTDAGLARIGQLLPRLTARDDLYPGVTHADLTDDAPAVRLHAEADGSLMLALARFPSDEPTRVHNHNSWGVACIYKGVDLYIKWERQDDGSRPGYADVAPVEQKLLTRGESTYWLDVPHDLHSQWGQEGHVAWELVLMGRNNQGLDRLFFEPEEHRVWAGPVSELRSAAGGYRPATVASANVSSGAVIPAAGKGTTGSGQTVREAVEAFARDVEQIMASAPDRPTAVARIKPRLAQLLTRPDLLDEHYRVVGPEGQERYSFYRSADGRLTIGGPVFRPGHPTVVHNHNTWGVIGIYSGKQRTGRYLRTDDGSVHGHARLRQTSDDVLGPGSIYFLLPPDDIHRIEAIDEPSLSIHVLGVDLGQQHRQFFDVEAETYRDVLGEGVMT
jgi:predicted metal-dependent enzyme (double-stranded beta helix superfamily)